MNGTDDDESTRSRPARPHTGRTEEGKRIREVLTYSRRGSRLGTRQEAAWGRRRDEWWIPDEAVDRRASTSGPGSAARRRWSSRSAPAWGRPPSRWRPRARRTTCWRFEVWQPGVADTLHRMEQAGVDNVRLISVDAVWSLGTWWRRARSTSCGRSSPTRGPRSGTTGAGWSTPSSPALAASRLAPGALWRLATDWADYAERMVEVLDAEPLLENVHDGPAPRWDDRPLTRFERRGLDAGRPITDLTYRRV